MFFFFSFFDDLRVSKYYSEERCSIGFSIILLRDNTDVDVFDLSMLLISSGSHVQLFKSFTKKKKRFLLLIFWVFVFMLSTAFALIFITFGNVLIL